MIYQGQSLRQFFTTGIPDTDVKEIELKYIKPSGIESKITEDITLEAGSTYYVDFLAGFLDEPGIWTFWSFVKDELDNTFPGTPFQIRVIAEGTGPLPITKEFIKSYLGISDTTQDAKIDAQIPLLVEDYMNIRNAPFSRTAGGTIVYPDSFPVVIAEMYNYKNTPDVGIVSERIGDYSVSYRDRWDIYKGYPLSITRSIKQFVRAV